MPVLFQYNKKGFTLIEAVLSTFILSVGVLAIFGVIQMIVSFTSGISSRLQATYLAQEGIENIRNIRDSNWLVQRDNPALAWDQGISTTDWVTIDKFQRKIIISKPQSDKLEVSVQVNWPGPGGSSAQLSADTELYDWR
ncbi:MAG: prepilin-type N-terminal cleavage/methylation domain-containing protein [Candidatus Nealsonbacteria bacterium]|nr:prepilin-type N-terminal cleavage/methylation domain-containing protein [Candidatus Nealsonbacteria bacterium]